MEEIIQTPYGEVRADGLEALQNNFDTRQLLRAADELDRFCAQWKKDLRDDLLEVHGMAHTVLNGAPLSRVPGRESLPEAAHSLAEEFREWRDSLAAAIALLDPIAELTPD